MSILIRGMEMPDHCLRCPFMVSRDNDDCILQSDEANESFESWEQMKVGCPLAHIPPHGRLIDADALKKKRQWTDDFFETEYVEVEDIDDAPTIIEAEVKE